MDGTTAQQQAEEWAEWPTSLATRDGDLFLDGCNLSTIANRFGTPTWVYSLQTVEQNYRRFADAWHSAHSRIECAFSMKANHLFPVLRRLIKLGASVDCTGETELLIAVEAGVDPAKIIVNGNGKSERTLRLAAELGVRQVNLDSLAEAQRLESIARQVGSVVDCTVRLQMGYKRLLELDPAFAPMLKVWENKFGASTFTGEAERIVKTILDSPHLRFVGLHHHVGFSAVTGHYEASLDVAHHREATRELCEFAQKLSVPIDRIDVGGGFPVGKAISITPPQSSAAGKLEALPELSRYVEAVTRVVNEYFTPAASPAIQLESGRYPVQNAGVLITTIADVKIDHGEPPRRFITVDSSMQQFTQFGFAQTRPRPTVVTRQKDQSNGLFLTDIVGQTCVYDAIAENQLLGPAEVGDLVLIPTHGAYTDVSGTNFNAMPRPASVVVEHGRAALAKRRENVSDILSRHTQTELEWNDAK